MTYGKCRKILNRENTHTHTHTHTHPRNLRFLLFLCCSSASLPTFCYWNIPRHSLPPCISISYVSYLECLLHSSLQFCGTLRSLPLFREAALLPSVVQVLPSPMLLSFIWHKLLCLFVSLSSRAPHGVPSAWHLADTQQVLLDWIHSG